MTEDSKVQTESSTTGKKTDKKVMVATTVTCPHCSGSHPIFKCEKFLKLSPQERYTEIKQKNMCINCLKVGHKSLNCKGSSCKKCNYKHNTLLHKEQNQEKPTEKKSQETSKTEAASTVHHSLVDEKEIHPQEREGQNQETDEGYQTTTHCVPEHITRVILSTARVYIEDIDGNMHKCRALLDPGSQLNMITEELVTKLKIPYKEIKIPVSGANKSRFTINKAIRIKLTSTTLKFTVRQECLLISVITDHIP